MSHWAPQIESEINGRWVLRAHWDDPKISEKIEISELQWLRHIGLTPKLTEKVLNIWQKEINELSIVKAHLAYSEINKKSVIYEKNKVMGFRLLRPIINSKSK